MRKYVCDKCGREFDKEWHWSAPTNGYAVANLWVLTLQPITTSLPLESFKIGEYCEECKNLIEANLKRRGEEK